jgi:hypothetical protein
VDRPAPPPKRSLRRNLLLAAAALAVLCAFTVDRRKLGRTVKMITSIQFGQVRELLGGPGQVGVLAAASTSDTVTLPDGTVLPRVRGRLPLERKPLPPLPMEDHPFMLDEYASGGVHADSYNSGVSPLPGPLGLDPVARVVKVLEDDIAMCTPLMRDLEDRLASVCISLGGPSHLVLFDPEDDFRILARTEIPKRRSLIDPAGGWYSRMDHKGRPVVPTPAQDVRVYEAVAEGSGLRWNIAEQWDLSSVLPEDVSASDVVPDWRGNYWFISGFGHLGYIDRASGAVDVIELGGGDETIGAALTVGPEAAFVLTSKALYRLEADGGGPRVVWRWDYGAAGGVDLSTPTLIDEGSLIAFSINGQGDRGLLLVLETAAAAMSDSEREVCRMPLFKPGRSDMKNTLMGYGRSLVAENNWGGDFFELLDFEPGLARVDVREDHSGCDLVWEDYTIASQVPPRLSTGDGHIYLYARERGTPEDVHAFYLTAIDFRTGEVASELFVGSGRGIDNPMLSSDFWPGGVFVGGIRNGIVTLRDGSAPSPAPSPEAPASSPEAPSPPPVSPP